MFGYVLADASRLTKEENERYRSFYCGLCRSLKKNCGNISRLTLNYDLTFLALFLSAVYNDKSEPENKTCVLHPLTKNPSIENEFSDYSAYMNVVLSYYKLIDDWKDDKSLFAIAKAELFKNTVKKAEETYPKKCEAIKASLEKLSKIEKDNVLNPDVPSALFGELMGELFAVRDDEKRESLYRFGFFLGKFIYILDAVNDLKKDVRKKRYNPLVLYSSSDFEDIINMMMADVAAAYKKLNITREQGMIENILFSGILLKYRMLGRRQNDARPL